MHRKKTRFLLLFSVIITIVLILTVNCKVFNVFYVFYVGNDYKVTLTEIVSKKGERINSFTIAIYERDSLMLSLRPDNFKEIDRYCCSFIGEGKSSKKVFFNKLKDGYIWQRCHLVLDFVEKDSLKNLSIKEKLAMVNVGKPESFDKMPFEFNRNKVYHLFGFNNFEGSYYLTLDDSDNLIVDYFDGGAW